MEDVKHEQLLMLTFSRAATTEFKKRLLKRKSLEDKMKVRLSINEFGKHNEIYWSDEFPKAIEWLFFSTKED